MEKEEGRRAEKRYLKGCTIENKNIDEEYEKAKKFLMRKLKD